MELIYFLPFFGFLFNITSIIIIIYLKLMTLHFQLKIVLEAKFLDLIFEKIYEILELLFVSTWLNIFVTFLV